MLPFRGLLVLALLSAGSSEEIDWDAVVRARMAEIDPRCVAEGQKFLRAYGSYNAGAVPVIERECMEQIRAGLLIVTFEQREAERAERKRRETIAVVVWLTLTVLIGGFLAWHLGRPSLIRRRLWWIAFGIYVVASVSAVLVALRGEHDAIPVSLLLNSAWVAVLLAVIYRSAVRATVRASLGSGWGRLGIVTWATWVGYWGYDLLHRRYVNEGYVFRAIGWGIVAPLIGLLVGRWIIAGFRQPTPVASSSERTSIREAASSSGPVHPTPAVAPASLEPIVESRPSDTAAVAGDDSVTSEPESQSKPAAKATPSEAQARPGIALVWKIVLPVVSLAAFAVVMGPAKDCGRFIGKGVGRAVGTAMRPAAPTEWTPEWTQKLLPRDWSIGIPVSATDKQEINACFIARIIASIPGGPAAAERLGEQRVQSIAMQAGKDCGKSYSERLMTSDSWTPAATALLAKVCTASMKGATPAYCACFAREIPKRYTSPAAFKAVNDDPARARSARERSRIEAVNTACAATLP